MCKDEAYMYGACDPTERTNATPQKEEANKKAMGECKNFVKEAYKTYKGQKVCRKNKQRGGKTLKKKKRRKRKGKHKSLKKRR